MTRIALNWLVLGVFLGICIQMLAGCADSSSWDKSGGCMALPLCGVW